MQRFFDVLFSILALIILGPLLIPIVLILRFSGEGEVFYIQQRVGKDNKMFGLFKFATMLKDSPNMAMGTVTVKGDPRILPVGNFLRKTKINELPQLLNILLGDMSVIGPRPQAERCFLAFPVDVQHTIVKVKPGLSGIGSIVFRDEENMLDNPNIDRLKFYDEVIAPYKGALEKWYVEHHSLYSYFMLILLTIWSIPFSDTRLYKVVFKDLPLPCKELEAIL